MSDRLDLCRKLGIDTDGVLTAARPGEGRVRAEDLWDGLRTVNGCRCFLRENGGRLYLSVYVHHGPGLDLTRVDEVIRRSGFALARMTSGSRGGLVSHATWRLNP
jgi:hypothetical protein